MPTLMPTDDNNNPIPTLRLRDGAAHSIAASTIAARNSTGFNAETQIISLYATVPVFIRFGNSSVTATTSDHYFPAGIYYDMSIGGESQRQATHLSVIRAEPTDGAVYISEKI